MSSRLSVRCISVTAITVLLVMTVSPIYAKAPMLQSEFIKSGPFVDKIFYKVIRERAQQVLALQNNDIDLIGDKIHPDYVPELEQAENIEVMSEQRNGYGFLFINCAKYPLNITAFRRAFAIALDKHRVADDVWGGAAQPQDSVIPSVSPWTVEGQLPYTYYEGNIEGARQILADAEFHDADEDGWLDAPNGEPFSILIEVSLMSEIAIGCGLIAEETLVALGINAKAVGVDLWGYLSRLNHHGDYDMAFMGYSFGNFDVDWMVNDFWSELSNVSFCNPSNFKNTTFDSWIDKLLYSTDYDSVYEAAIEMQRILVYESPVVVFYQNYQLSAIRTDRFEGHIKSPSGLLGGWWTNQKVRLKTEVGGPFGGTFRWSNQRLTTLNPMVASASYDNYVLDELYDSLLRIDPSGYDILWLASGYATETHEDNEWVSEGHTRFTFDIIDNATWSDGQPITAYDVAHSMNYLRGTSYYPELLGVAAAFAPTEHSVVIEYDTESYWHLHDVGYMSIYPKHLLLEIGPDGWNTWNPQPPNEPMITSGPFNISEHLDGEFTELTYNPNYFYGIDRNPSTQTTPTTTTSGTTTPTTVDLTMPVAAGVLGAATVIIIGSLGILQRSKIINPKKA